MHKFLMLSVTGLFALAGLALLGPDADAAQKGKKKKGGNAALFKKLDADGDGKLSPQEFAAIATLKKKGGKAGKGKGLTRLFTKLDTNGDGFLSKKEFAKFKHRSKKKAATTAASESPRHRVAVSINARAAEAVIRSGSGAALPAATSGRRSPGRFAG